MYSSLYYSSDTPLIQSKNLEYFSYTKIVKSPPSSKIMFKGFLSAKTKICSMHLKYSYVLLFQANTCITAFVLAAAAWSWIGTYLVPTEYVTTRAL